MKQREHEIIEERYAIEEDLPNQFEARFKKAKSLYYHLFTNPGLNFDQASPLHELKDRVLPPPSDDEDEIAYEDVATEACSFLIAGDALGLFVFKF